MIRVAEQQYRTEKLNYRMLGSVAYDVRVPQRTGVQLPDEKPIQQPARSVRAKAHISPVTVLGIVVTAFLAVLVIFCYVRIYEVNHTVAALSAQLEALEEKQTRLKGQYESQLDMLDLEAHARQLGLKKPDQSQIVYLDLSGADHADITPAAEKNVVVTFLTSVFRSVRDFLEYLS